MSFTYNLSRPESSTEFPQITLRKGNTEIKIKDPATLIRKMEELFPKGVNKNLHSELIARELTNKKIEHGIGQNDPFEDPLLVIPNDPEPIPPFAQSEICTVNKNAYELREMILEKAISVVHETNKNISTDVFVDKVLEVSDKFYSFVENRRKNR